MHSLCMASYAVRFFLLLALGIDVYVTQHLDLTSQAHVWIFLEVAAQPELLHKREGVGICRRGNGYPIFPPQPITMAIGEFPQATIDWDVVFQRGVAYMISGGYFDLDIFTYKSNGWHDSILQGFFITYRKIQPIADWQWTSIPCQNIAQRARGVNSQSG